MEAAEGRLLLTGRSRPVLLKGGGSGDSTNLGCAPLLLHYL
jgi:hypothetical protein